MRESIGSTFLYNIIFIFIIIVMGILTATLNYYKAYKVNNYILNIIRDNSGYNANAVTRINDILSSYGYSEGGNNAQNRCPRRGNGRVPTMITAQKVKANTNYFYCVYYYPDETKKNSNDVNADNRPLYYAYGVTTFISIDLPIAGQFRIPVFTKGNRIYRFNGSCQLGVDC